MASFHPTIQPKVHIPDITHPTFYITTSLQWFRDHHVIPPSFQVNPPHRTPSPPPLGATGDSPTDPNTVGPSQPPHLC